MVICGPHAQEANSLKRTPFRISHFYSTPILTTDDQGDFMYFDGDGDEPQAFPTPTQDSYPGMSLREFYAGCALQGMLANGLDWEKACELSFQVANRMTGNG